jgi:hypothetical protein
VTDFLAELEQQMTEAAHRAVAERARPRVRLWPTLALVGAATAAIGVMFVLPERREPAPPAKQPFVSLKGTTIGVYNVAGIEGLASPAGAAIRRLGPVPDVGTAPGTLRYSVVLADEAHAAQARRVARTLGIERFGAPRALADKRSFDITVLLGKDFATPTARLLSSFAFLRESPNERIFTTAGSARVIASRAGLCLQTHDRAGWGGGCADVADALAGKLVVSRRGENGRLLGAVGLVPDWIDAVELDGGTRRVPVGRNLWTIGSEQVRTVKVGATTLTVP